MSFDLSFWNRLSIRLRLILLFAAINVFSLMLLLWGAWTQTQSTTERVGGQITYLTETASETINEVGDMVIGDLIDSVDEGARDEIEYMATSSALRVAAFLYGRDADIRSIAKVRPNESAYRDFVQNMWRNVITHGPWRLNAEGTEWEAVNTISKEDALRYSLMATPGSYDNVSHFHYRPPQFFSTKKLPLYLEITFVGLDGMEKLKVTTSPRMNPALNDISRRANTYAKAENYFSELKRLKPGEIYVSDVIGTYVGSPIIGKFTPEAAETHGIAFEPEKYAYAGKENPVGKRFHGIVRWATPVLNKEGRIEGWVTLALDHDHLMQFTDTIVPMDERYRDINDASDGNYAFMWDYKGRSIVHPRHHSIVGYDKNGDPQMPWLEETVYEDFLKSGKSWSEYMKTAPTFVDQRQNKRPAKALAESGNIGLDCRWLNFAPQCIGWYNIADLGGSGSFYILWSGLWKLTTVASIPYYTGQYSQEVAGNRRGFGIITIGANIDGFHASIASKTKKLLDNAIDDANATLVGQGKIADSFLHEYMLDTTYRLIAWAFVLVIAMIGVAFWLAGFLAKKVIWLNEGYNRFRLGDHKFRFQYTYHDEITSLADSFNEMADTINANLDELQREVEARRETEQELRDMHNTLEIRIAERTSELSREVETRRQTEVRLHYMAHHDPLTDLANRSLFNEQLRRALLQSKRTGKYGALLFLDLDKFKRINDTLGHDIGDALLIHMAGVLKDRVRSGTDTAARLGGDEFAVIIVDMEQPESAAVLAQEILDKLEAPVVLGGHTLQICSSIGIVTFPDTENTEIQDADNVIKHADTAMYLAKSSGGMRYCFFEQALQNKVGNERLIRELRVALAEHQFTAFFQPVYHTDAEEALYVETLARWQHPQGNLLSAESFIGPATQGGLLEKIDMQMLDIACAHARRWLDAGLSFGRISVNLSQCEFDHVGFMKHLEHVLEHYQLEPFCLAFDIPESVLMKNSAQSTRLIKDLRRKGVHIIIDKLQTDYPAISNLLEYTVDAVKIHHPLTSRIGETRVNAMISSIASMANAVHIRLIAAGVENEQQWRFFEGLHCEIIQGFYHAPPMSAEEMQHYLETQKAGELSLRNRNDSTV